MEGDKPFKGTMEDFDIHMMFYIPSTHGTIKHRVEESLKFLNKTFGGSTAIRAMGSYTGQDKNLIKEGVELIEVYTHTPDWKKNKGKVKKWLKAKKKAWKQEAMAMMFEEDMYWV